MSGARTIVIAPEAVEGVRSSTPWIQLVIVSTFEANDIVVCLAIADRREVYRHGGVKATSSRPVYRNASGQRLAVMPEKGDLMLLGRERR